MSRNQKSTLPVLVIPQKSITARNKRYMIYLTTTLIWMCIAIVLVGYSKI